MGKYHIITNPIELKIGFKPIFRIMLY